MKLICSFGLLRLVCAFVLTGTLMGQVPDAGSGDAGFSMDGKAVATLPGASSLGHACDVQPDGSVVVAGQAWSGGTTYRMVVTRFTPTGELDAAFGTNGFVTYGPAAGMPYAARAVKVLADGKILVAGDQGNVFVLVRLLADGTLDASFSPTRSRGATDVRLSGMAVQPDGKILLCGSAWHHGSATLDAVLCRVQENGGLDSSFVSYGEFVFGEPGDQTGRCVLLQPDGKILFGGSTEGAQGTQGYIGRLTAAGALDISFGSGGTGVVRLSVAGASGQSVEGLALDSGGNVVAVATNAGQENEVVVLRRAADGSPDTLFGYQGQVLTSLGGAGSVPMGVQVQKDQRILIFGQWGGAETASVRLRRLEWNGTVDGSWGAEGLSSHGLGLGGVEAGGMVIQGDGRVLVAGTAVEEGFLKGLAAMRLHPGEPLPPPAITITRDLEGQVLELGMPMSLSVEVDSATPPVFTWYRNGEVVARGPSAVLEHAAVTEFQEASYRVVVQAGAVTTNSQTAVVKVRRPPMVTGHSEEVAAFQGLDVPLSVTATGRKPMIFKWFHEGELVRTETDVTSETAYFYPAIRTEEDAGEFSVEISNAEGEATVTGIRVFMVTDPSVGQVQEQLLETGQSFALVPEIYSTTDFRLKWRKDGRVLPEMEDETAYSVAAARLEDGGVYTTTIRSARGSFKSAPMTVGVVDTRARSHFAAAGKKFQMTVPVSGERMSFRWFKGETVVAAREGLAGVDGNTLTFASPAREDEGDYVCVVSLGGEELRTEVQSLTIVDEAPVLEEMELPAGYVGTPYVADLELPASTSYLQVKGLPAGLEYSPEDHCITGTVGKAGDFEVSLTAINPVGKSNVVKLPLRILRLAETLSGRYQGVLNDGTTVGEWDSTVSKNGVFTGTVTLSAMKGKVSRASFKGVLEGSPAAVPGQPPVYYKASGGVGVKGYAPGRESSSYDLTVDGSGHMTVRLTVHYLEEDYEWTLLHEYYPLRCPWSAKKPLDAARVGQFNVGLSEGMYWAGMPGGYGYAVVKTTAAGAMNVTGRLSDGTALTVSCPVNVGHGGEALRHLYGNRGSLACNFFVQPGSMGPDYLDAGITGGVVWIKTPGSAAGQKNYPAEFSGYVEVMGGGKYLRPNHPSELVGPYMMNFPPAPQRTAQVSLLSSSTYGPLTAQHSIQLPKGEDENPAGLQSLKFNAGMGLISGSGVYVTEDYAYDPRREDYVLKTLRQPYKVQGMVLREPEHLESYGTGYTQLTEIFEDYETGRRMKMKLSFPVEIGRAY